MTVVRDPHEAPPTRYAVLYTLHAGRERLYSVDAWITGAPSTVKVGDIAEVLRGSGHAVIFSDRGVFLANRRLVTEAQLPQGTNGTSAVEIEWSELTASADKLVQLNVRVTAAERAAIQNAAKAAGESVADWVRHACRARLAPPLERVP